MQQIVTSRKRRAELRAKALKPYVPAPPPPQLCDALNPCLKLRFEKHFAVLCPSCFQCLIDAARAAANLR